jgi:tryptophan synthase alpha chain
MSARLHRRLLQEREAGRKLFVPFLTAGDRGLDFTRRAVLALEKAGADAVELGVPFSDPLADGKVIQHASERALRQGTTLAGILDLIRDLRRETEIPLVLMGYLNPFLRHGMAATLAQAAAAGADGFIVPDLPPDEAGEWTRVCRQEDLDTIFLVAPTSTPERIRAVARASSAYIYYVSITGTTGARRELPEDLQAGIQRVRRVSSLPVLIGFGVSTPEQAGQAAKIADGVIVGSALVATLEPGASEEKALVHLTELAQKMVREVKKR